MTEQTPTDAGDAPPPTSVERTLRRHKKGPWVSRLVATAIVILVVTVVVRTFRRIDVATVWDALSSVPLWSPLLFLPLLIIRQIFSAAPLSIFLPGVGLYRCTINDLSSNTASAFAPAPSDIVLRVAMFRSWGIDGPRALAATAMNSMTFYIVRFSAPLLGFVLLPLLSVGPGLRWFDLVSLFIAAFLVTVVLLVLRGRKEARRIGLAMGGMVRRVRGTTDPEVWAGGFASFQENLSERFGYRFPRSLACSAGMVLMDLVILLVAMRMIGIRPDDLSILEVGVAYLFAFPLTMFPAQGLGVMDTAMLASLTETAGHEIAEPAIAAMIVWRVMIVAAPLLLGLAAMLLWRFTGRNAAVAGADTAAGTSDGSDEAPSA
ncbi:lysylphosphatidylglycerol synthase domain-containing protein [Brachybacterium sp. YJGR34]|uniref:lysylphosphatidylglycerol synthase domain-containing protein n=1 Tax=Brachybacterium sp. YJGR34 TaxID=2059911 RepID=UPI0013007FF6|nr:lysylphosphatidylglycerol synthase domain-containing protein [Brachybacterium sp. YJGR34]